MADRTFQAALRSTASPARSRDAAAAKCTHRVQSRLGSLAATERRLPALLGLYCDQAIVGIAGSITSFSERGFVSGLLEFELHDALLFTPGFHVPSFGLQRRLDGHRLNGTKKRSRAIVLAAGPAEQLTTKRSPQWPQDRSPASNARPPRPDLTPPPCRRR